VARVRVRVLVCCRKPVCAPVFARSALPAVRCFHLVARPLNNAAVAVPIGAAARTRPVKFAARRTVLAARVDVEAEDEAYCESWRALGPMELTKSYATSVLRRVVESRLPGRCQSHGAGCRGLKFEHWQLKWRSGDGLDKTAATMELAAPNWRVEAQSLAEMEALRVGQELVESCGRQSVACCPRSKRGIHIRWQQAE